MAEAPVDDVTVQQDLLTGRVVRWSENPLVWNYTGPFLKFYLFSIMDLRVELILVFHFFFSFFFFLYTLRFQAGRRKSKFGRGRA